MKKQDVRRAQADTDQVDASGIAARIKAGVGLKRALTLCAEEAAASGFAMACLLIGAAAEAIEDDLSGMGLQAPAATNVLN